MFKLLVPEIELDELEGSKIQNEAVTFSPFTKMSAPSVPAVFAHKIEFSNAKVLPSKRMEIPP